jgi:long-chain acyl-CoA synthetase
MLDPHDGGVVALVEGDRRVTYGELRSDVAVRRGGLHRLGVSAGDRVAVIAGNTVDAVATYLAVLGIGAILVPVNPASPPPELARELGVVTPKLVLSDGGSAGQPLSELAGGDPAPVIDVAPRELAALIFTSGTATAPRAAMLTHGSIGANIDQLLAVPDTTHAGDVVFGVLPLFHVFGLTVAMALTLTAGATLVLVSRFDRDGALATIAAQRVTIVPAAPPVWVAWARADDVTREAFASIRHGLSGAAKLPEDVARAIEARYGLTLREGYGLTEASPVVTTSLGIEPRHGSVGHALEGVELRLVDSDGEDALEGDPGEVWVRGPNVFAGYWEDPVATAAVLDGDGWLHTGDVAVAEDGYLYIVGRAKDLIIVSGFNVYPAEVEHVVAEFPGVAEAAVIGVPDPETGEAVKALVVPTGQVLDLDALIAYCRDHLARYKCPTAVEMVDALPKGMAGKLLRSRLR